jgi:hypothetical protein
MVNLIVCYPTTASAAFDRDDDMTTHMPMVDRQFGPLGMTGWHVVFPDQPDPSFAALATLDFADDAAFAAIQPVTMKARPA